MNVCITGVNGFIGRNVALALLAAGHEVCGVDRMDKPFDARVGYLQGDITDEATATALFARFAPAALVHLAALVHKAGQDLSMERYRAINATASERLFETALAAGVQQILFSSTIEVYGSPDVPLVDENTPVNPLSYYAKSKLEAEEALLRLIEERVFSIEKTAQKDLDGEEYTVPEPANEAPLSAQDTQQVQETQAAQSVLHTKEINPSGSTDNGLPKGRSPFGRSSSPRRAILRFAPVYAADFRLNLDKRFYLPGKRAAYVFRDGGYSFHFCAVENVCGFIARYLGSDAASGTYIISDAEPVVAREFIALERAAAQKAGRKLRVVRMPYGLSFAAIACAEFAFRLFSRSEPFLSRYNFRKLFKSVVYDSAKAWAAVGAPEAGIGSLYIDTVPGGKQNG